MPSWRRTLQKFALYVLACLVLAYPVDWAVWRLLLLVGHGMGTVNVTQTTAATLKGNRFEVYSQQQATVACSHSLLPQAGAGACWWLRTHPDLITQY